MEEYRGDKTKYGAVTRAHGEAKALAARRLRRVMTPAERRLWFHLRANRLDGLHFRRQQPLDGFIPDFYCHAAGLILELDGPIHGRQADYDAARDRVLRERSLRVLRVSNAQVVADCPAVLAQIRAAARHPPPE